MRRPLVSLPLANCVEPRFVGGRLRRLPLLVGISAVMLSGATEARAGLCSTAALGTYLSAGFSCSIGDVVYSAFIYSDTVTGGANSVLPSSITVTPIVTPGNSGFTWTFATPLDAATGQTNDAEFQFNAITLITELDHLSGTFDGALSGTGTFDTVLPLPFLSSLNFGPTSGVTVHTTLDLAGGTAGDAALTSFSDELSEVPERGSLAMLAVGLAALAGLKGLRRAKHKMYTS